MNPLPPMLFINKLQKYVNNINNINIINDELLNIKNELNNYMSFHEIIDDNNTYIMNKITTNKRGMVVTMAIDQKIFLWNS